MTEIKSNISCTRCGKDILYCTCENSPKARIEQLEQENAELKAQIEKMKRPQNCKYSGSDYCMSNGYCVCDKWELAE